MAHSRGDEICRVHLQSTVFVAFFKAKVKSVMWFAIVCSCASVYMLLQEAVQIMPDEVPGALDKAVQMATPCSSSATY